MIKRIGIVLLLIGAVVVFGIFVNKPKPSAPPAPVPPAPPVMIPATNPPVEPAPTNPPAAPAPVIAPVVTNAPDTNPPPAMAAVVVAPETNPPTVVPPVVAVVETNPPTVIESSGPPVQGVRCSMVRNLLTDSFTNNLTDNREFFYRLRAGFEHAQFGNVKNTWYLGAKFYERPQAWRDDLRANTNRIAALLIPDVMAGVEHSAIEITDDNRNRSTEEGVKITGGFYWPWLCWKSAPPENSADDDLHFTLGPTVNGGVEENTSGNDPDMNWFYYGGVRLAASPDAFVEFTVGQNDDLTGLREQVVGEIPIYRKARSDFRYILRGVWNESSSQDGNFFEADIMVEFPFEALEHPSNFRDLIPFIK